MTWVKYLVELARHGYRRNRYEVAAYRVEDDAREPACRSGRGPTDARRSS